MTVLAPVRSSVLRQRATPKEPIWPMRVEQYHAMIRAGILTDDDPIELLEGLLVLKMAKNPRHRVVTGLVRQALEQVITKSWYVDSQEPITTIDSEPEPDGTVVRGNRLDYLDYHPSPADIALVVEVSDATLRRDRGTKKRIYARAGIPVYWIVNLVQNQVEVYTGPVKTTEPPEYQQRKVYKAGDSLPVLLDGVEIAQIAVDSLLPKPTK